jgi:gliding motility-associated-like protein
MCVTIKGNATKNVIQYCTFNCSNNTTTSGIINIEDGNNNNNIIRNNTFTGDINIAIRYFNTSGSADNTQILNNQFNRCLISGILASNTNGVNSWIVKGNSFFSSATINYSSSAAIVHFVNAKDILIDSNFFGGGSAYCGNPTYSAQLNDAREFRCIYFQNSTSGTASRIIRNRFSNFEFTPVNSAKAKVELVSLSGAGSFDVGALNEANFFGDVNSTKLTFYIKNNSKVVLIENNASGTINISRNSFNDIEFKESDFSLVENGANAGVTTIDYNLFATNSSGIRGIGSPNISLSQNIINSLTNSKVTVQGNEVKGSYSIKGIFNGFYFPISRDVIIKDNLFNTESIYSDQNLTQIYVKSIGIVLIENNEIKNVELSNSTYRGVVVESATNLTLRGNQFGTSKIKLNFSEGKIIDINAQNTLTPSILFEKNTIENYIVKGNNDTDTLVIFRANAKVDSNKVLSAIQSDKGLIVFYTNVGIEFTRNIVQDITVQSGLVRPLLVNYQNSNNQPINIQKNAIYNNMLDTNEGDVIAMDIISTKPVNSLSIINNFIQLNKTLNYYLAGIRIDHSSTVSNATVYHNTIDLQKSGSFTNATTSSICLKVNGNINTMVKNNIFQNACNSTGTNLVEDYSSCLGSVASDYNYLYAYNPNQYALGKSPATIASLIKWLETSKNSTGGLPLTINNQGIISDFFDGAGKGEVIGGITTDRLGSTRSNTAPWMGCYEGYQTYVPNLSLTGYCIGGKLTINPRIVGLYPTSPPTTFTVQLSDINGNFATGTRTLNTFTNANPIPSSIECDIPTSITPSTQYKIRIISTLPTGLNEVNISTPGFISLGISPSFTLTSTSDQVCTNNSVSLNLPPNLSYAWSRNTVSGLSSLKLKDSLNQVTAPGSVFKDSLWLDANITSATTTYTITPYSNGCKGNSVNFTRTVIRKPFTPASLPDGYVGQVYPAQQVLVDGSIVPISLYSGALPSGLTINATTNTIQGTPINRGTYTFTLRAGVSTSCVSQQNYSIVIRDLFNANLDFTPVLVAKSYGDEPFTIPITSRSNAPITYSIEANTAATIDATSGKVTILNALPNVTSFIWVYASQPATAVFASSKDSVRLFISRAKPRLRLISGNTYSLGKPNLLLYEISKNYPVSTTPAEPIQSDQPSIALVSADADSIYPLALGTFNVLFSFPATTNHFAFDTIIAFKVIKLPIPPIAVNDTIIVIRNPDKTFTVDTINILANDTSKTGLIITKLTDIDETNIGSQYLYYKPSIGTFQYDTLNGNLIMNPYSGLQGTTFINYTLVDEDGLSSAPAKIVIIVVDQSETPPLQANQVMTPNGDGNNDALVIGYTDVSKPNYIMIFDIAGNTLYQSDNYQNDWSGQDKNGKDLESGIYFYVFKEKTGSQRELTGYVKIIR